MKARPRLAMRCRPRTHLWTVPLLLISGPSQARDINLDIKRVVSYRYWCNKLWNAIRFAMMNLPEGFTPLSQDNISTQLGSWPHAARWILSRLNQAVDTVNKVGAGGGAGNAASDTLIDTAGLYCKQKTQSPLLGCLLLWLVRYTLQARYTLPSHRPEAALLQACILALLTSPNPSPGHGGV